MRFWGPGNVKNVMKQTPMCQLRDIRQQTAGNTSFKWDSYARVSNGGGCPLSPMYGLSIIPQRTLSIPKPYISLLPHTPGPLGSL